MTLPERNTPDDRLRLSPGEQIAPSSAPGTARTKRRPGFTVPVGPDLVRPVAPRRLSAVRGRCAGQQAVSRTLSESFPRSPRRRSSLA